MGVKMNIRYILWGILVVVLFATVVPVHAFDGKRKGFICEWGIGAGLSHIHASKLSGSKSVLRSGPVIQAKLGLAPNNQLVLHFGYKMCMCYFDEIVESFEDYGDKMAGDDIKAIGYILISPFALVVIPLQGSHSILPEFGLTYFFDEQAPSFFMEGTVGGALIADSFNDRLKSGIGFNIGGGYEFKSRINVKLNIVYGHEKHQGTTYYEEDKHKTYAMSCLLTLNFMLY